MSADNGIYIAKFPDGYRVAEAQAIENINYYPVGSGARKKVLKEYFGRSRIYKTLKKAQDAAFRLLTKNVYVEYGVQYLGEYESFNKIK